MKCWEISLYRGFFPPAHRTICALLLLIIPVTVSRGVGVGVASSQQSKWKFRRMRWSVMNCFKSRVLTKDGGRGGGNHPLPHHVISEKVPVKKSPERGLYLFHCGRPFPMENTAFGQIRIKIIAWNARGGCFCRTTRQPLNYLNLKASNSPECKELNEGGGG